MPLRFMEPLTFKMINGFSPVTAPETVTFTCDVN